MTAREIYDQLTQFCDCVDDITMKDVEDMISVVSLATGWLKDPCESFLTSERREVIDLPSCMDCPYTFEPYYYPFDPDTFSVSLLTVQGIDETLIPVPEFRYSEVEGVLRIDTGLVPCHCLPCDVCGCPPEYKLVITYEAGYDTIPDCLLPVFCNLIEVIHAKNDCDCCEKGCTSCDNETAKYDQYGNIVTQQIKYKSGDVVSVFLETDLGKLLVEQYKSQLGMMSLVKKSHDVWGYVV